MSNLKDLCETIINALKDSDEYKEYKEAYMCIKENPELLTRVNELREKNYQLHMDNSEDIVDLVDALTNEYDDVINNESASRFLQAEASFCNIMKEMNVSVVKGLELD